MLGEPDCPRVLKIENTDYSNRVLFEALLNDTLELLDVGQQGAHELFVVVCFPLFILNKEKTMEVGP